MRTIDLKPFLANEDEVRTHLKAPMRSKHGAVACNGHIMICIDDDGDYVATLESLETAFDKFATIEMPSAIAVAGIVLPTAEPCFVCDGSGYMYHEECDECDGEGEFDHGTHTYECKECGGDGYTESSKAFSGSKKVPCYKCDGRKEAFKEHPVGDSQYSVAYLRLLQTLPNCILQPRGMETAKFTFDGGWGALMPVHKDKS